MRGSEGAGQPGTAPGAGQAGKAGPHRPLGQPASDDWDLLRPRGGQRRLRRRWPLTLAIGAVAALAVIASPLQHDLSSLAARLPGLQSLSAQADLGPIVSTQAQTFAGTPAVGALFTRNGQKLSDHFCTASVVDSPGRDMLITAAHCVSGTPVSTMAFVPGYHNGKRPYGVWPISRVLVDHDWAASSDPADDVAFLIAGKLGSRDIQQVTGGEQLGLGTVPTGIVRVVGYPMTAGAPVRCDNRVLGFGPTQLRFNCAGFSTGTSGSALLTGVNPTTGLGTVVGVIGGYELGGNTANVSYAARFTARVATLYHAADRSSR